MRMEKISMVMVRIHNDHNAAVNRLLNIKFKLISQICHSFDNLTSSNQLSIVPRPMVVGIIIVFGVFALNRCSTETTRLQSITLGC
jgi:hypothetical protein